MASALLSSEVLLDVEDMVTLICDQTKEDLVERLVDNQAIFEVLEQVEQARFSAEWVKPERKDTGFAFAVRSIDCTIVSAPCSLSGARARCWRGWQWMRGWDGGFWRWGKRGRATCNSRWGWRFEGLIQHADEDLWFEEEYRKIHRAWAGWEE